MQVVAFSRPGPGPLFEGLMEAKWRPCEFDPSFRRRDYPSYGAYVAKQVSKLARLDLTEYDVQFRAALGERLEALSFLQPRMTVLCLGARSGAEVQAFLDLGCFAVGIDLNPGEDNWLVQVGDFHDILYEADSADVIFTNSLDHVFDIFKVIEEIRRVLKPGGFLIVEAVPGTEEGAHLDSWDCFCWPTRDALARLFETSGFKLIGRTSFHFPWHGEQLCFESKRGDGG